MSEADPDGVFQSVWVWMAQELTEGQADLLLTAYVLYQAGNLSLEPQRPNHARTAEALARRGLLRNPRHGAFIPTDAGGSVALVVARNRVR